MSLKFLEMYFFSPDKLIKKKIMSARSMPVASGVDLEREERLKKGEICIEHFKVTMQNPAMKHLSEKKNEVFF